MTGVNPQRVPPTESTSTARDIKAYIDFAMWGISVLTAFVAILKSHSGGEFLLRAFLSIAGIYVLIFAALMPAAWVMQLTEESKSETARLVENVVLVLCVGVGIIGGLILGNTVFYNHARHATPAAKLLMRALGLILLAVPGFFAYRKFAQRASQ